MEEGVRAIAKTSNFQSEHVRLKTIFFAGRDCEENGFKTSEYTAKLQLEDKSQEVRIWLVSEHLRTLVGGDFNRSIKVIGVPHTNL